MAKTVLVTGSTGNLGREVVKALLAARYAVRAAAREVSKVPSAKGVTPVQFDYTDASTFEAALASTEGVFLVAPPLDPAAPDKLIPFIDRTKQAGIRHVVLTSALGADLSEKAPLRVVELYLMGSGLPYTILRPTFLMENFSIGFLAPMIRDRGEITVAAGDGKTGFIATQDIARVAAAVFKKGLTGKAYNLTGPEALDYGQVAQKSSLSLNRPIAYRAIDEMTLLKGARDQGMPEGAVQYLAALYAPVRAGRLAIVTDEVQALSGRRPTSFDEFVKKNAACWRP